MIRHIVTWNYKEGISDDENKANALKIKTELESLVQCIEGIIEINVWINELSSSNRDMLLNSLHESEDALAKYQIHPEHKKISEFIGAVMQNRACIDYYE